MTDSIFISHNRNSQDDIAGKITYTNILETIPSQRTTIKNENWENENKTEWRWRFFEFEKSRSKSNKKKFVVEISYMKPHTNKRLYFNKFGEWVERLIDEVYDDYVKEIYYYYATDQ